MPVIILSLGAGPEAEINVSTMQMRMGRKSWAILKIPRATAFWYRRMPRGEQRAFLGNTQSIIEQAYDAVGSYCIQTSINAIFQFTSKRGSAEFIVQADGEKVLLRFDRMTHTLQAARVGDYELIRVPYTAGVNISSDGKQSMALTRKSDPITLELLRATASN